MGMLINYQTFSIKIAGLAELFNRSMAFLPYTKLQNLNIHQNYTLAKSYKVFLIVVE